MDDRVAPPARPREAYAVGDLRLDVGSQRVTGPAGEIVLPKLSFDLLLTLVRRAPDFVNNDDLASLVWAGIVVSPETVTKRANLLREALGDSAANPRYVGGLRSRGYRIVAPVRRIEDDGGTAASPSPEPLPTEQIQASSRPARPSRLRGVPVSAAVTMVVIALVTGIAWWLTRGRPESTPTELQGVSVGAGATIAVLPFENLSAQPDDAYLAVGIPDMVMDRLSTISNLTLIAQGSALTEKNVALDPREAGRRLGADYLVQGSTQRTADRLRVTARLVETRTGTQVWSTHLDRRMTDIFEIQDAIADQVRKELVQRVAGIEASGSRTKYEPPIQALLAYLQARELLARHTIKDADRAAVHFEKAVALDPEFADAHAGLFDARMLAAERRHGDLSQELERNLPLIERALSLDPQSGPAHIARAIWSDGDETRREADFRRGLELDPNNGRGLVAYAEFLRSRDRVDEAKAVIERALVVDPRAPRAHFLEVMLGLEAEGGLAREAGMKRVLELDPNYHPALQRYAKYRWQFHGQLTEAAQIIERAIEIDPTNPWSRHTAAAIYLDLRDPDAARDVASATESSRSTARVLLGLYTADWRSAGEAALSKAGSEYNVYESWGVPEAVRDFALHTGDYPRGIGFLEERYRLAGRPTLDISNFRAAACLAHLLQVAGHRERAEQLLLELPGAIDATIPLHGTVYALRAKAAAQLLMGDRGAAVATLQRSFESGDFVQWWYTLEHDPLWRPLQQDAAFKAIASQVRARVEIERAALDQARRDGRLVARGSAARGAKGTESAK